MTVLSLALEVGGLRAGSTVNCTNCKPGSSFELVSLTKPTLALVVFLIHRTSSHCHCGGRDAQVCLS